MPRYSRSRYSSRYRSYRRGWRRYYRRKFRRSFSRFVNGTSKSMVRVKIPVSAVFSVNAVGSSGSVFNQVITPWAISGGAAVGNPFSALGSPLYRLYTELYEEVKCIGMKIVLSIGTPIGTSSVPSLTVITAFDRRFSIDASGEAGVTYAQLNQYSSQQKATAVNNSIAKLVRSVYASDLMERAQWHDCTLDIQDGIATDKACLDAADNPNFFCPGMYLGVSQTGSTTQTISFQADIMYYFAFRNPKYGGSTALTSSRALARGVSFAPEFETLDDEVGAMDTHRGDAELEATAAALRSARIADSHDRMMASLREKSRAKLMDDKVIQKR